MPVELLVCVLVAGLLGVGVGSSLGLVADRVAAGIPRASRSARHPGIGAATGAAFAAVTWFFLAEDSTGSASATGVAPTVIVIVAYLWFAAVSIVLTLIDLETHRLPDVIVLPSCAVAILLFTGACLLGADWWSLLRAGTGMAALFVFYAALRLIRPDGMGGGDVKLAGVVGLYLGWLGWSSIAVGAIAAFVLGGLFGVVLLVTRRASRRTAIPFGPWMLAGAWTGVFAGGLIGGLYGGLHVS